MKIIDVPQGSPEWFEVRMGIATASEFDALVTPLWKLRTGSGVESYIARKLAERWRGSPLPSFHSGQMEQGSVLEQEARPWYEFETGRSLKTVGFVLSDFGTCGCSPDGMFDDGTGIEIKCPECHTHTRYLLDGKLPADYRAQVQGSMFVTAAEHWTFLSYCRGFPPLLVRVEREDKAQEAISAAMAAFNAAMAEGWDRLCMINGGPPKQQTHAEKMAAMATIYEETR